MCDFDLEFRREAVFFHLVYILWHSLGRLFCLFSVPKSSKTGWFLVKLIKGTQSFFSRKQEILIFSPNETHQKHNLIFSTSHNWKIFKLTSSSPTESIWETLSSQVHDGLGGQKECLNFRARFVRSVNWSSPYSAFVLLVL